MKAIDFEQQDRVEEIEVGAIILATGHEMFDASQMQPVRLRPLPDVYTAPRVRAHGQRRAASPAARSSDQRRAGTRRRSASSTASAAATRATCRYCSSRLLHVLAQVRPPLREHTDADASTSSTSTCAASGKATRSSTTGSCDEGVRFVRGKVASIVNEARAPARQGKLVVQVEDTLGRRGAPHPARHGHPGERPARPRATPTPWAGCSACRATRTASSSSSTPSSTRWARPTSASSSPAPAPAPRTSPHTVAQASAAAAGALTLLRRGKVTLESIAAHVQDELCSGCRTCLELCPYSAVGFDETTHRAEIDDTSCHGCGTCVAACPSGALTQDHFTRRADLRGDSRGCCAGRRCGTGRPRRPPRRPPDRGYQDSVSWYASRRRVRAVVPVHPHVDRDRAAARVRPGEGLVEAEVLLAPGDDRAARVVEAQVVVEARRHVEAHAQGLARRHDELVVVRVGRTSPTVPLMVPAALTTWAAVRLLFGSTSVDPVGVAAAARRGVGRLEADRARRPRTR